MCGRYDDTVTIYYHVRVRVHAFPVQSFDFFSISVKKHPTHRFPERLIFKSVRIPCRSNHRIGLRNFGTTGRDIGGSVRPPICCPVPSAVQLNRHFSCLFCPSADRLLNAIKINKLDLKIIVCYSRRRPNKRKID